MNIGNKHKKILVIIRILAIAFFIIVILILAVRFHSTRKNLEEMGWSFDRKENEITIKSTDYDEALEYLETSEYDTAEKLFLKVLKKEETENGSDSPEAALVSQKLGSLYLEEGRYEDAYDRLIDAYTTFRKIYGDKDVNTIEAKCQISTYEIETGDVEQGFAELDEAYDQSTYVYDKMGIFQSIARCYTMLGNYKRAYEFYERLANYYSSGIFDTEDAERGQACNDLGILLIEVGEYDMAVDSLTAAADYYTENDHVRADIYGNLARAYAKTGENEEALDAGNRALQILKEKYQTKNIFFAEACENMAEMYGSMDDQDRQKEYLDKALDIALSTVGENHESTALIYCNLGEYYYLQGDVEQAIDNHNHALEIRKNILGLNNLKTAAVYEYLATDYYRDDIKKSIENAERAIDICDNLFTKDNPNAAYAFAVAAKSFNKAGNEKKAEKYIDTAVQLCEKHLKGAYVTSAYTYRVAGQYYRKQGDYDAAEKYLRKSLLIYRETEGEKHMDTAEGYLRLGDLYVIENDAKQANNMYKRAYQTYGFLNTSESELQKVFRHRIRKMDPKKQFEEWLNEAKTDE